MARATTQTTRSGRMPARGAKAAPRTARKPAATAGKPQARAARPGKKRTTEVDRAIGSKIRLRRGELGMTQQQLARELGVTFQQLQKYEQGTNRVSGNRIAALAKALEVPVSYFFEQTADEMEAVKGSLLDTRGSISLLRAYAGIKEQSQRAALVNVARALVGEGPLDDSAAR